MQRVLIIFAIPLVLAAMALPMHVRQDIGWVDAFSGTRRSQTVWWIAGKSPVVVTPSALEQRFKQLGLQWTPDWRYLHGTSRNLAGRSVGFACGRAPAIYTLSGDSSSVIIDRCTDDELRDLFHVLTNGDEEQQKKVVDELADRALAR